MRPPKLNNLKAFEVTGRHLNFRLAAEEMHVTQGAVAQQVRGLEADLGRQLFRRLPRGLALTADGQRYHARISEALGLISEATRDLTARDADVTISVPPSFATKWLVPRLADFTADHPDITLKVLAEETVVDFASGRADLAVRQGTQPAGRGLRVTSLGPVGLVAVAGPGFAGTGRRFETLADFVPLNLIEDGHTHWTHLFSEAGLTATGRMLRLNQTALAMDAAVAGQGVALVPGIYLPPSIATGALVPLWRPDTTDDGGFWAVCPARATPATRAVAAWVADMAKTNTGSTPGSAKDG